MVSEIIMEKLTRQDLYSLERYAEMREEFRTRVMKHKHNRVVHLGPNATLYFEDRLTMQYQIQEMLRVERIFESAGIEEELGAYNPLIPDGGNWKATFMIEVPDEEQRRQKLALWKGIEGMVWVQVGEMEPVFAIADEDMERENEEKTSAVHFMRFELTPEMVAAAKNGAAISMGVKHNMYTRTVDTIPDATRQSLVADLD